MRKEMGLNGVTMTKPLLDAYNDKVHKQAGDLLSVYDPNDHAQGPGHQGGMWMEFQANRARNIVRTEETIMNAIPGQYGHSTDFDPRGPFKANQLRNHPTGMAFPIQITRTKTEYDGVGFANPYGGYPFTEALKVLSERRSHMPLP